MVRISRVTQASTAPVFIRIVTDRISTTVNIPGPMNSIEIPGDRILDLDIAEFHLYGIRIVIEGEEYRLRDIRDLRRYPRVDAILIFDGFLWSTYPITPGYTYRPQFIRGDQLRESGKSFIYPGQPFNPQFGCGPY